LEKFPHRAAASNVKRLFIDGSDWRSRSIT
jgi:hypothetical protein